MPFFGGMEAAKRSPVLSFQIRAFLLVIVPLIIVLLVANGLATSLFYEDRYLSL
jgi:hypothetical protein